MFEAAFKNQDFSSRAVQRNADYRAGQRSHQMPNTQDWASVASAAIRERGAKDRALIAAGNNMATTGLRQQGQMGSQALAGQAQIASQGIASKGSVKGTKIEADALLEAEKMKRQISPKDVMRMAAGGYVMTKAFDSMKQQGSGGLNAEIVKDLMNDSGSGSSEAVVQGLINGLGNSDNFTPQLQAVPAIQPAAPFEWKGSVVQPLAPKQ